MSVMAYAAASTRSAGPLLFVCYLISTVFQLSSLLLFVNTWSPLPRSPQDLPVRPCLPILCCVFAAGCFGVDGLCCGLHEICQCGAPFAFSVYLLALRSSLLPGIGGVSHDSADSRPRHLAGLTN